MNDKEMYLANGNDDKIGKGEFVSEGDGVNQGQYLFGLIISLFLLPHTTRNFFSLFFL